MAVITTRAGKGSPLTNAEVDSNFTNLNTELGQKLPLSGGTVTGDVMIQKGNAWLTIDSSSSGGNGVEQGAGISIGESGYKGAAAVHITYTGDGYAHWGMGAVDAVTNIPAQRFMRSFYTSKNVEFYGTVTATEFSGPLAGNASTATSLQTTRSINGTNFNGTANITTANWGTARTLSFTGDVAGSASVNGSQNVATAMTLANSGVTAGTYTKLTVDAKGRATSGGSLTAADIPELTLDKLPSSTYKRSVRVATTANITLSGVQTIDGVTVAAGDRVLVKNQTTAAQNGIYVVSSGAWTRAADADNSSEIGAAVVAVDSGSAGGGEMWTTTFKTTDTIGTTSMNWYEVLFNTGTWGINITGGAAKLTTARTINGTSFNGTANIVTSYWGTARTITIGATGKSVNGSGNVSWTLAEIGAQAAGNYVTLDTAQTISGEKAFSTVTDFTAPGNQILLKNGTSNDPTVIHRADGNTYYILLSAAGATASGSWNTLRPFSIHQTTGLLSSANGQSFGGGLTSSGQIQVVRTAAATDAHLLLTGQSGGLSRESKLRFAGTFGSSADTGARLIASLRAGFDAGAWGTEYLDLYINSTPNDAVSDANQHRVVRFNQNRSAVFYGSISATSATLGAATISSWSNANTDIDGLIGGSAFGALLVGAGAGHFTVGLASNDLGDGFQVISREANNATYTLKCFEVLANGNANVAGTLTAPTFSGALSGNATTATTLATARNINGVSFDGSSDITITAAANGGNADTVDSLHASSFFRRDTSNATDVRLAAGDGRGLRFWDSDSYKIWMSSAGSTAWGGRISGDTTSDYNMYFRIASGTNRGFVFESAYATKLFAINPNGVRSAVNVTAPTFVGALSGNAATVTNGVYTTGNQTIGGTKTFSSEIRGNLRVPDTYGSGNGIFSGTADGASSTSANIQVKSWYGVGFAPSITGQAVPQNENAVWINVRNGALNARGTITAPTFSGALSGNATTATTLQTARTINGTSFNGSSNIEITEWIHSQRDFPNGTLVTTNINYAVTNGDPWVLEIRGNSYGSIIPFDIQYQGYIYNGSMINYGGYSNGKNITGLVAINVGGNLCFWWPNQTYWHGYNVRVYVPDAGRPANRVTSISNSGKPSSTKEVPLTNNLYQSVTYIGSSVVDSLSWTAPTYFVANKNTASGSNPPLQAYSNNGGGAMMSFHRSGYYAVNMGLDSDNVFRIGGWSAGANRLTLDMSGNLTAAGLMQSQIFYDSNDTSYYCDPNGTSNMWSINAQAFNNVSDDRLKTRLGLIENPLDKVAALDGFMFIPNAAGLSEGMDDRPKPGLSAQQVRQVLDGVVDDDGAYLTLNYPAVIPLLVEAIKALTARLEAVETQLIGA